MTVTVKGNAPIVVPLSALRKAGFKAGDKLRFETCGNGVITIRATADIRSEYTATQREFIDSEIAKGLDEIKRGKICGPFESADDLAAWLKTPDTAKHARRKSRK
jgi:bifunctional DNA-binding transcriptional regulator/antitoxin component of YhaV-PrlF toxin-antitoxin module